MKKLYLLLLFVSISFVSAFAQTVEYIDDNGATWNFSLLKNWDNQTRQYIIYAASLSSVSNYGDEIIVPSTVTYNEVEYPVIRIGESVFKDNKSVSKIILPSSIKRIDSFAFQGCSSLKEVGDMSNCEYIDYGVFNGCISLTTVDLSSCIEIHSSAFKTCQNLISIGSLAKIGSIGEYAFSECKSLKEIDLPSNITIEANAFNYCTSLSEIGSLDGTFIGNNAFYHCNSLKSVDLSTANKIGEWAFAGCTTLESVGDLSNITSLYDGVFYNCISLKEVDLSSCKTIGNQALYGCERLINLSLGACLKIGYQSFAYCNGLTSINLSSCATIGTYAFRNCINIHQVDGFSHFTDIPDGLFYNCYVLDTIDLSNCETIGENAFFGCSSLKNLQLQKVKTIGKAAFYRCYSLEAVNLPLLEILPDGLEGVWYDDDNNRHNESRGTFSECSALKSVNIPLCKKIGSHSFEKCIELTSIGTLNKCDSIESWAFGGCNKLGDVIIESTALNHIGYYAFTHTGTVSFMNVTPATIDAKTFGPYLMILVPADALSTYQTADIWKDFANRIFAIGDTFDFDIEVKANDNTSCLQNVIGKDNLRKVVSLKVTGSMNSYDIMIIRNQTPNLHYLDLTDANIVECSQEYYTGCYSQNNTVGDNMFRDLTKLLTIKLPRTTIAIGNSAFRDCNNLQDITMYEGIESLGGYTFYSCSQLKEIVLPNGLKSIGTWAFYNCNSLEDIEFPNTLISINGGAFYNCSNLKTISLPTSLQTISENAFLNCSNLKEVKIPSSITNIYENAFAGCWNLNKVYTYTIEPTSINQNTFSTYSTATLYVPTTSYDNYYWDTEWNQFSKLEEFDEPYSYFYINKDYTLDEDERIDGTPDADLNPGGSLTVEGEDNQIIDDLTVVSNGDNGQSGSVIADNNISANWLKFEIKVVPNKWYFFGFPFRILLSNIEFDQEDVNYVFRYYDGETRAENGNGGWKNLPANTEALERGVGYIFQCNKAANLILKVEKPDFTAEDIEQTLETHESAQAQNAGWNFIGNPQMSYYDINDTEYSAPITIWNGSSYEVIRPIDDIYHFHPFQGFFVQKPDNKDKIKFGKDNRTTYLKAQKKNQVAQARRMTRGINEERTLIELTIGDTEARDKTRIVFNEKATAGYETLCDAAKFMSTEDVPQIYSLDNEGAKYAINERPAGEVKIGYLVKTAGTYKIAAIRMDKNVTLYDDVTKTEFDFTTGDYSFESEAGTFDNRFTLKIPAGASTGLAEIKSQTGVNVMSNADGIQISNVGDAMVDVYSLGGVQLAKGVRDGFISLPKATYIVKVNNLSTKVMVK